MFDKKILSTSIIAGLVFLLAAMFVIASESPAGRVEYLVPKITCGACAQTIRAELEKLTGVAGVEVEVAQTLVKVSFNEKETDAAEIAFALNRAGYPGSIVSLNGKVAPGAKQAFKTSGGCGGNCCEK